MSDIRNKCPLECVCKNEPKRECDDYFCIRHKAYKQGRADEKESYKDVIIGLTQEDIRRVKKQTSSEIFDLLYNKAREQGVYSSEYVAFVAGVEKAYKGD